MVDATNHVAGRLASIVAKQLLYGESIAIVNAEGVMVSGRRLSLFRELEERLEVASVVNPRHGPFHPRRPDTILTRMVRGMLPRKKPAGLRALRRLRVYVGVPPRYREGEKTIFKEALITRPAAYYVPLGELAKRIGWRGVKEW